MQHSNTTTKDGSGDAPRRRRCMRLACPSRHSVCWSSANSHSICICWTALSIVDSDTKKAEVAPEQTAEPGQLVQAGGLASDLLLDRLESYQR
mmetsp:Transcript_969/g.2192  ORF Transcript_969/g.2192 Transcript_969/m.2192 type:complete len:93 (+) Transcript_969:984-1262(+)